MDPILVTGGAGFIGGNFVLAERAGGHARVVNVDKLTYAGHLETLASLRDDPDHVFVRGDIRDGALVRRLLRGHRPIGIVHFAAETHVDRSIDGPASFVETNVAGTLVLLDAALEYWRTLRSPDRERFRFLHVSTDEVFGSLGPDGYFTEESPYRPNSPYAASKAAADHMVRSYHQTYGLPTLIVNCSNNYGPYQFPEKLIPLMILKGCAAEAMPVYGDGLHVRDWLYVEDHCAAVWQVLGAGEPGSSYVVGGNGERTNLEIVRAICAELDAQRPHGAPHERLVELVPDRPGHDRRYAIDASRIRRELGWRPKVDVESGIRRTVAWYLAHRTWCNAVRRDRYGGERLGLAYGT